MSKKQEVKAEVVTPEVQPEIVAPDLVVDPVVEIETAIKDLGVKPEISQDPKAKKEQIDQAILDALAQVVFDTGYYVGKQMSDHVRDIANRIKHYNTL